MIVIYIFSPIYRYYFLCQKWLAVGKDDGQISRELIPVDKSVLEKSVGKKDGARQDVALEIKGKDWQNLEIPFVYLVL